MKLLNLFSRRPKPGQSSFKGPKSQVYRKRRKEAPRPWTGVLSIRNLYQVAESNYTVATCLDAVSADRTKMGWEWLQEDESAEASPEQDAIRDLAEKLLRQPNGQMTGKDLLKAVNYDLEVAADAFIEVVWADLISPETGLVIGKRPVELWPVPAGTVWIQPVDNTGRLPEPSEGPAYIQKQDGQTVASWTRDEIIHIQANSQQHRLYGRPKLLAVAILIGLQQSALGYNLQVFTGQKIPKQLVSLEASVEDIERMLDQAQEKLEESPHNVPFIAGGKGAQVLKLMDSMREMEFLELLKYAERSILARWRVPPVSIGISETGGAGIVVGRTQIDKYWDMIEEGNENISESLTQFFREYMGLEEYYLHIPSDRPRDDMEQAQEDDIRIRHNVLTINEARAGMGLEPVEWGDSPFSPMGQPEPQVPQIPGLFSTLPSAVVPYPSPVWPRNKGLSPRSLGVRQDHGVKVQADPEADKLTQTFSLALVRLFRDMRQELLALVQSHDIIFASAGQIRKAQGITQEQLLGDAGRIAEKYAALMGDAAAGPLMESYLSGKTSAAMDLQARVQFSSADWQRLEDLRLAWANTSIKTFNMEQVAVIEESLAQVRDAPDLFQYRVLVEEALEENLWEEAWKLDRIARTSLNRCSNHARGEEYRAVAAEEDPEVTWITAGDMRVRDSHAVLEGQTMKLSEALRILDNDINCRCRILRKQGLPPGVPEPEDLMADIKAAEKAAREEAVEWYIREHPELEDWL